MTDMTPEEINRRISTWAGLDSHVCDEWSFHCDDCERGSIQTPDYYHANAAMDLLGVLVERGYGVSMSTVHKVPEHLPQLLPPGWMACVELDGLPVVDALGPTIPAAICHAIMEIIEREGE